MRFLLLVGALAIVLAIPSVSPGDPILYTDRASFEAQGCVQENYGFEDWPAGTFSYPPNPWNVHGVTYRCTENLIVGMGTYPYNPMSNILINNYWTPINADVDPGYTMLGFDASDCTYDTYGASMSFTIHTTNGIFAFNGLPVPRSMDSIGQFYGWVATGSGETITGFDMASPGSPHGAAVDNVTLGVPGPSATEATTWGGIKATYR